MRTGKDIEWSKVDFANHSLKDYYEDILMIRLVSHYVRLTRGEQSYEDQQYFGSFEKDGKTNSVMVDIEHNCCLVNKEIINPEELICLFEGEDADPIPIIKEITGIDHEDYCTDVTYKDGTIELLEVKGKCLLLFGLPKSCQ